MWVERNVVGNNNSSERGEIRARLDEGKFLEKLGDSLYLRTIRIYGARSPHATTTK
jgi:hypothetical protein